MCKKRIADGKFGISRIKTTEMSICKNGELRTARRCDSITKNIEKVRRWSRMKEIELMEELRAILYKKFQLMNDTLYLNPNDKGLKSKVNSELEFITEIDKKIMRLKNGS